MEADKISIRSTVFAIAAVLVIELTASVAFGDRLAVPYAGLGMTRILEVFVMLIIVYLVENQLDVIGLPPGGILRGVRKGLIWSAGFGVIAGLSFLILLAFGFNALNIMRASLNGGTPAIILLLIVGGLIGPVAEEIFFRGILYGFFRRWGILTALVITTLLFVFSHPNRTGLPITQLVGAVVFALAYEIEDNLMVPIVIHCLGNLAIFSIGFLA